MIDLKSIEEKYLRKVTEISGDGTYISFGGETNIRLTNDDGSICVKGIGVNGTSYFEHLCYHYGNVLVYDDIELAFGNGQDFSMGYDSTENKFRIVTGYDIQADANVAFEIDSSKNCRVINDLVVDGALKVDNNSVHKDGTWALFGANDCAFRWATAPTNDALTLLLLCGSADRSGNFIIKHYNDYDGDMGHAISVDPKLIGHSATLSGVATDEWWSITHDQTDAIIKAGKGDVKIDCGLNITGDVKYTSWRSKEIFLDENTANVANKPTLISRGLFGGYSLPEYAANEELKFRMRIPHSWDGTTNPYFIAITAISGAEDIGDKYKFQIEWQSADIGSVIPDTTQETLTHEVTVVNGTAYYGEIISFELDATTLVAGQNLQIRLRRIAPAAPSVSNEVVIFHWDSRWKMDKLGTESIQGY
jgi:hypothetical protein